MKKNKKVKFNLRLKNIEFNFEKEESIEVLNKNEVENKSEDGTDDQINENDTKNNSMFWKIKKKIKMLITTISIMVVGIVGFSSDLISTIIGVLELF